MFISSWLCRGLGNRAALAETHTCNFFSFHQVMIRGRNPQRTKLQRCTRLDNLLGRCGVEERWCSIIAAWFTRHHM